MEAKDRKARAPKAKANPREAKRATTAETLGKAASGGRKVAASSAEETTMPEIVQKDQAREACINLRPTDGRTAGAGLRGVDLP